MAVGWSQGELRVRTKKKYICKNLIILLRHFTMVAPVPPAWLHALHHVLLIYLFNKIEFRIKNGKKNYCYCYHLNLCEVYLIFVPFFLARCRLLAHSLFFLYRRCQRSHHQQQTAKAQISLCRANWFKDETRARRLSILSASWWGLAQTTWLRTYSHAHTPRARYYMGCRDENGLPKYISSTLSTNVYSVCVFSFHFCEIGEHITIRFGTEMCHYRVTPFASVIYRMDETSRIKFIDKNQRTHIHTHTRTTTRITHSGA